MARVDYTPVPGVQARDTAPDDLQHVQASPDAFGASLDQGMAQAGQGMGQAVHFYGQVASDNATNNTLQQVTNILHGDPSKTVVGPDGQTVPDTGYFGLRGANAMSAREPTSAAIDKAIAQNRSSLQTPEAQYQYDADTRRWRSQWYSQVGEHADTQQRTWSIDTNNTTATLALNDLARKPGDDDTFTDVQHRVRTAFVRNAQLNGESADGAMLKADQQVAMGQVRALLTTDPVSARAALDKHMDVLAAAPGTYQLQQEVNARAADYMASAMSDPAAIAKARAGGEFTVPGLSATSTNLAKMIQITGLSESHGHERDASGNLITSPKGAQGLMQVMPTTNTDPGYGVTPARNNSDAERTRVGADYLGALVKHYNDPAKAWAAYNWGPGHLDNAIQKYGADWFQHAPEETQNYVSKNVAALQGGSGIGVGHVGQDADGDDAPLTSWARSQAQSVFPNNPEMVEHVVRTFSMNIKRDDAMQVAKVADATKDVISFLQDGGDPTKVTMTPAQIRQQVAGPRGVAMAEELQGSLDFNKAYRQLSTASQPQIDQILKQFQPTGPQDFQEKSQYFGALQKAAEARRQAIFGAGKKQGDPAAYVHSAMPDVAHALDASVNSNDPNAFAGYVHKLQGAYGALGIPAESQRILPNSMANGIVSNLQSAKPADALNSITSFQKEAGSYWPQVYRDLVRAGMPVSFQTPLIVAQNNPQNAQTMISAIQRDADARAHGKPAMEQEIDGIKVNGHSAKTLIDQTIASDFGLRDLRHTFGVAGRAGLDQYNGVEQTVKQTAHYLYLTGRVNDPARAAKQAAKMVTGNYDFIQQGDHPPARLPVGSSQDFHQATRFVLNALRPGDVISHAQEIGTNANHDQRVLDSAKQAYWVTIPGADGQGAVRAMDPATGQPVIIKNGKTLDIPFSKMKAVAARNPPSWLSNTFPSIWGH